MAEARCDKNPSKLMFKIVEGNLLEVACDDCKKRMRREGKQVKIVLHRYDVTGELIETEIR